MSHFKCNINDFTITGTVSIITCNCFRDHHEIKITESINQLTKNSDFLMFECSYESRESFESLEPGDSLGHA